MDGPRALIVDDDSSIRSLLKLTLSDSGFSVLEAENGKHALDICRDGFPDLIVTDILMPDMDGLELIAAVQGLNPDAKIIAISGHNGMSQPLVLQMSETLGASQVLTKPFATDRLVELAQELTAAA